MLSCQDWRRSCLPPPLWIPAFAGMIGTSAGDSNGRRHTGYENWVRSSVEVFERRCCLEPLFPL